MSLYLHVEAEVLKPRNLRDLLHLSSFLIIPNHRGDQLMVVTLQLQEADVPDDQKIEQLGLELN